MQHVMLELKVPSSVAEGPVQPHKGRIFSLIAPSELPVLKFQFLELAAGERPSKQTHKPEVQVVVVLVFCPIYKIKIPNDKPHGVVRGLGGGNFRKEGLLLAVIGWAIDRGQLERSTAGSNRDIRRNQVCADMDVGDVHMFVIPKQENATPGAESRAMREGAKMSL
jgi:hypothetical protein